MKNSDTQSLNIKRSKRSSQSSQKRCNSSDGINFPIIINIIITPLRVKSSLPISIRILFQPLHSIFSTFFEMCAYNFFRKFQSRILCNVVFPSWFWICIRRFWLKGVIGNHILSELIYIIECFIGCISYKNFRYFSAVWFDVLAMFIDGSWESIHFWVPAFESLFGFNNSFGADL